MKTLKRLIVALVVTIGTFTAAGGSIQATDKSVHHPIEECQGEFIKDQPPFSGKTVTAAYTGDMWIKIATQHVYVPVVTAGDVITPQSLSSWPTNKNGKFQAVSHVDYCVPVTPPTTEPPVEPPVTTDPPVTVPPPTTPPTTPPEGTQPPVTVPPVTTVTPDCPPFQYPQSYAADAPCGPVDPCVGVDPVTGEGTTLWLIQPCSVPVDAPTTPPTVTPTSTLPQTGPSGTVVALLIGALLALFGYSLIRFARKVS